MPSLIFSCHIPFPANRFPAALAGTVFLLAVAESRAASYVVSAINKTEIVGDSAAVPTSGATTNFSVGTVTVGSSFAKFQLFIAGSTTQVADMKVTLIGVNGTLDTSGGRSGLMVAQTVDSQGMDDSGTLSVLTDFSAAGAGGSSSVTLRFEFFEPYTDTALNLAMELTSFDYDYNQYLGIRNEDFLLEAHGSKITKTIGPAITTFADTKNSDSTFSMVSNAVALNNVADSEFEITVGKSSGTGNSLFMFEFRDPSTNLASPLTPLTPVPEPSGALLFLTGLCLASLRRKR